ncbi:MAG: hypothetical protein P8166_01795 [Candidatus Thiodiazotropha sp.]
MMPLCVDHQSRKPDLSDLERQHRTLDQLVDIARAIESMRESLRAVLLMGLASKDLLKEAPSSYCAFSEAMHTLPSGEIRERHTNIELIVNMQLNRILNYSSIDFSSAEGAEFISSGKSDPQRPLALLRAFKRSAQTAVSLRMLLLKRGVPIPESILSASNEEVKRHLSQLDRQLADQRRRITSQIEVVELEIDRLIANPHNADTMKSVLHKEAANLDLDRQLLAQGGSIDCLSFVAINDGTVTRDAATGRLGGSTL